LALAALGALFGACAHANEEDPGALGPGPSVGKDAAADAKCVCAPDTTAECACPSYGYGTKKCNKDCMSYSACTGCTDGGSAGKGGTAGAAGKGGAGGSAGASGVGGSSGLGGASGGGGAAGCTAAAQEDKCPGKALALTGSGNDTRVGTVSSSIANLCPDYKGSCQSNTTKDAVWAVTPDCDGLLKAETTNPGAFDPMLHARSSCTEASSELGCSDAGSTDVVSFPVFSGKTYYLFVANSSGLLWQGNYKLDVTVKPVICGNGAIEVPEECDDGNKLDNDGCSHECKFESAGPADLCPGKPLVLYELYGTRTGVASGDTSTLYAQYQGSCGTTAPSKDAVHEINTGPTGGTLTLRVGSSPGTDFDTVLYVRSGSCAKGTQIKCEDVDGYGGELVAFDTAPNATYWAFVDGRNGASGHYSLQATLVPPVCGDGFRSASEACDDGNKNAGDGCSPTCAWEGQCGTVKDTEPNGQASPQAVAAACGSFMLPLGTIDLTSDTDGDFFRINAAAGATITAWTFVGAPGTCQFMTNTVLSLWKDPIGNPTNLSGGCVTAGYLECNDDDPANAPCSKIGPHTVTAGEAGPLVVKVHDFSPVMPLQQYGLMVLVK
jgi:cysteine-rich repeat protein